MHVAIREVFDEDAAQAASEWADFELEFADLEEVDEELATLVEDEAMRANAAPEKGPESYGVTEAAIAVGAITTLAVAVGLLAKNDKIPEGTKKALEDAAARERRRKDEARILREQREQRQAAERAVREQKERNRQERERRRPPLS